MGSKEQNSLLCNDGSSEKNNYEDKFNTLRIISLKAINEFEDLQRQCEDNYSKYLEERENYLRTKKELEILKEVSGEALGEYENLHRKYTIEQECRDKAEEYAKQQVKQNKQLKRQSTFLLSTLAAKVVDIDLEELASHTEMNDTSTPIDDHGVCNKQIEALKEQVESLQMKTEDLTQKLLNTEQKLHLEMQEHLKVKEELDSNKTNLKQLKRVSYLALDDYANLQEKYEMEVECRAQAEKLAAEEPKESNEIKETTASRDHDAVMKQSEVISMDVSGEERLQHALDEINELTKKLHEQKAEFDEKVKELEEELASSSDAQKLKSLEEKINTFAQGMETLETRLTTTQKRANEAETKAKMLEDQLKKAQASPVVPPPPPLPPPPPPPPAPALLLKKFVGIVSGSGKKGLKKSKSTSKEEDVRMKAMSEMMDRIKSGRVELKKTVQRQVASESAMDGSAMDNLRDVLKAIKRSPSKDDMEQDLSHEREEKKETFGVQLRKLGDRKRRSHSDTDSGDSNVFTKPVLLRKPRSHSSGTSLQDDDGSTSMDRDLFKLLQKQKAACEIAPKPLIKKKDSNSETVGNHERNHETPQSHEKQNETAEATQKNNNEAVAKEQPISDETPQENGHTR